MTTRRIGIEIVAVTVIAIILVGCGISPEKEVEKTSVSVEQEMGQAPTSINQHTKQDFTEDTTTQNTTDELIVQYEDNFAVDSASAKKFAEQIKDVTAEKNLDGLAELTSFPVYVGLEDVGVVETKEAFLQLGAESVFTKELMESIEKAAIDSLLPSMAGFSISDGGKANINFGVVNGKLAITGINY